MAKLKFSHLWYFLTLTQIYFAGASNHNTYRIIEERTSGWDFPHDSQRHECDRVCSKNDSPKTCHYTFVIEQHTSMGKVILIVKRGSDHTFKIVAF